MDTQLIKKNRKLINRQRAEKYRQHHWEIATMLDRLVGEYGMNRVKNVMRRFMRLPDYEAALNYLRNG